MDIRPSYTCLLGRLWIHVAGAVTSTLHQRLKFIVQDKVVIIGGEEDVVINNVTSFRYVEVDGEVHETPFQALEIVSVDRVPTMLENTQKYGVPLVSLRDAKAIVESGVSNGDWGKVIEVREKQDKSGLGFRSPFSDHVGTNPIMLKGKQVPLFSKVFVKAGPEAQGQIHAIDDEDDADMAQYIYQIAPDQELGNWTATDIPEVVFFDM